MTPTLTIKVDYTVANPGPGGIEPTGADCVSITDIQDPGGSTPAGKFNRIRNYIPAGKTITMPPGTISEPGAMDFPPVFPVYAAWCPRSLIGSGADYSVIEMAPSTLSAAAKAKITATKEPGTIPYMVLRVDGPLVQDFTLRGTPQGVDPATGKQFSYHGLQQYEPTNPVTRRLKILAIPGSASVPPNETFPLSIYRGQGLWTVEDVTIDGQGVGSAAITYSTATGKVLDILLNRVSVTGCPYGAGTTVFDQFVNSWKAIDFKANGTMTGNNFEQVNVHGGAQNSGPGEGIVLVRPDISNFNPLHQVSNDYRHLSIDSSVAGGGRSGVGVSNRVDIYNPVGVDAAHKFGACISGGYGYAQVKNGPQAQRGADIHLWMGGYWDDSLSKYIGGVEHPELIEFTRTPGAA